MTRAILALFASSVSYGAVEGTYRFTTPQTPQSLQEATTIVRVVAAVPQASADTPTATLTFSGPAEAVSLASWLLPQIDRTTGDAALHEYKLPSGDIARVVFFSNASRPQDMQELLTILRTVDDVQKIFSFSSNHAMVLRGPDWQVAFAQWIIDQLNQPVSQKPDPTPREFTVGGPDFRGSGHGARINFLAGMTSPIQMQELLTVLRTVGDVMKVFSYTSSHALILRPAETDLQRAEWIIQQLDQPATHAPGANVFTAPAGDDVTRIFSIPNATPQWIQSAVTALRTDLNIRKIFPTTAPANIVVRGTADQMAAVAGWMASHNALGE